jgi:hypothetical protein
MILVDLMNTMNGEELQPVVGVFTDHIITLVGENTNQRLQRLKTDTKQNRLPNSTYLFSP